MGKGKGTGMGTCKGMVIGRSTDRGNGISMGRGQRWGKDKLTDGSIARICRSRDTGRGVGGMKVEEEVRSYNFQ